MESYKQACKRAVKQSRKSKFTMEEIKMQKHIDRVIREELKEMRMKVKKIKTNMQMMSVLSGAANFAGPVATGLYTAYAVKKYGDKVKETAEKADVTLDNIGQAAVSATTLMDNLNAILTGIKSKFDGLMSYVAGDIDVLAVIGQIVTALTQLMFARPERMIHSFITSLAQIFLQFGFSKLWDYLMRNFINKVKVNKQSAGSETRTILSKIIEYFGYAIAGLIGSVALKEGIMSKQGLDLLKNIGSICLLIKTVKDLDRAFPKIFGSISEFLYAQFGIIPAEEMDSVISGYEQWKKQVMDVLYREPQSQESAGDRISYSREFVLDIERLHKESIELSKAMAEKKIKTGDMEMFRRLCKNVEDLFKKTDTSGAFGGKPRTEPVIIWLYGEAGQGKSYLSMPFAMMLTKIFNANMEDDRLFSEIYMRNVEQEYWDGYTGQSVVIYDDFGQKVDSSTAVNPEFMEVIRAGNIAPFPLHMAHLEDKRRARFQSKAVILSSNVEKPQINSLTFPDAFFRRITVQLKVQCKPEYCYEAKEGVFRASYSKIHEEMQKRGMSDDDLFTDCYEFVRTNPEDSSEVLGVYNFDEVTEIIKNAALDKFNSTTNYIKKITKFAAAIQGDFDEEDFQDAKSTLNEDEEIDEQAEFVSSKDGHVESGSMLEDMKMSCYSFYVKYIKEHQFVKKISTDNYSYYFSKLESFGQRLNEQYEKAKQFVMENQGMILLGAVGSIVSAATMFGLWKYFSPGCDRIQIVSDGLGFRKAGRKDLLFANILRGDDKILMTERQFKHNRAALEAFCEQSDKYVKICVVPEGSFQSGDNITKAINKPKVEIIPSADNKTLASQKKIVEIIPSADNKTLASQKKIVEIIPSADNKTLSKPKIVMEGFQVSGDNVTRAAQKVKIECEEMIPAEMQMWKDEQAQTLITNRIWSNLYRISGVVGDNQIKPLLNGLFVRSRCMLVPGHLLDFLYRYSHLYIENLTGESYTIPLEDIHSIRVQDRFGGEKEAAVLVFPRTVKVHGDLVKHFSDGESMAMYRRADIALPLIRYGASIDKMFATILGNTECVAYDKPVILDDDDKGEYILRAGLRYKANTISGDCGAPVIVNENAVLRKIAGIHVAGSRDGSAFAESITQADLKRVFEYVGPNDKIIFDPDLTPNLAFYKFKTDLQLDAHYEREQILKAFNLPSDNFSFIGKCMRTVFVKGETQLRPSVIYGDVTTPTTKPCFLYHPEVDMYVKNLQKCATKTPYIEGTDLDAAVNDVKKKLFANTDRRLARILTDEESIQGSQDSEYIGPINRSTSAGYPWVLNKPSGGKGKQGWLGADEYTYDPELKKAVDRRIAFAKKGIRTPVVWTDTLKDERRPIAKVDSLKTRVFAHGPVDYTIAFRKYFLGFIAHIMENRIDNEQSIGTNVYSRDWAKTAKKLMEKGDKVIAGDFSTFDGTLNTGILSRFADVVSDWYDDGEENRLLRQVFMQDIYNSVHLVHDVYYQMNHSQPSGNPATTILNSFYNSVSMRMVFRRCARKANMPTTMNFFNDNVSMVSYGDDNVVNMSARVVSWFNQNTITQGYSEIGMIYTDEAKTGDATPDYRKINEVGYLKRNFIRRGNRWFAPLDLSTVLEMCNWRRGDTDPITATQVNCECAIMELSLHDKNIWDKWEPKIQQAFSKASGSYLDTLSYMEYEEKRLYDYFM